ncbi:sensor histidine kinase [Arachidicoccus terrestris]|uniref:sensor histidine kinase n=1 Tax=Arachidicoccus terrestris TaxID=2875539 RepID=UPI001CC70C5E|nr:histidine kinase [Arachidicoccus terrestris]UAY54822.1 histidine kinase [Arachidicoccus terrestris]
METGKNRILQSVLTLVFWACFLMLPFLFFPFDRDKSAFQSTRFVELYIFSILYLVAFYYVNSGWLIPRLLGKRKLLLYFLLILLAFLVYLSFYYLIWSNSTETIAYFNRRHGRPRGWRWYYFFRLGPIVLFLLAFTFSSVSKLMARWLYAEKIKEEVSKQQLQTELSLLRSQVNPHFLFNTLNSIYALTVSGNEKASDAVMKLSGIMRYTLEESQSEYVPLQNEVNFINNYLELQRIRSTDKVQIVFKVDTVGEQVRIAPLLLIPFIENAFKFGVSARQNTQIEVGIRVRGNTLVFTCVNDLLPKVNAPEGTGTGIVNVRRRLDLLYKKNYQLQITTTDHKYRVHLELDIIAQA